MFDSIIRNVLPLYAWQYLHKCTSSKRILKKMTIPHKACQKWITFVDVSSLMCHHKLLMSVITMLRVKAIRLGALHDANECCLWMRTSWTPWQWPLAKRCCSHQLCAEVACRWRRLGSLLIAGLESGVRVQNQASAVVTAAAPPTWGRLPLTSNSQLCRVLPIFLWQEELHFTV